MSAPPPAGPDRRAARGLRLAVALLFAGGLAAYFALGGGDWLTLDALQRHRDALIAYTQRHTWTAALGAVAVYAGAVALSVPGAVILSLAMGLLFGRWLGTALIVVAATLGATLVFLAARYLFADAVRRRLGERGTRLAAGFHAHAFHYLLFLRLVPLFPFWLVNLVPAFTPIATRIYVAATALGILPGAFVFANLGGALGRIESTADLLSASTVAALALLGVFALLPVAVKRWRDKNRPPADPKAADDGR